MPEKEEILISIVTHNSHHIFNVLDNLRQELAQDSSFHIVIFDNNSTREYQEHLKQYQDMAEIRCHEKNSGFGYGHNAVILPSDYRYGIIFNPDVIVTKDAMLKLINLIKEKPNAALIAPKVLNEDGTTQHVVRERLNLFDYFLRFMPSDRLKKRFDSRLAKFECRNLPDDKITTIRMASGCFLVVDINKFKKVHGFDERFFMYFEDNDLSLRLGQAGFDVLYDPFVTIVHLYGRGAHTSKKLFIIFMRSMIRFFNKWGWKIF